MKNLIARLLTPLTFAVLFIPSFAHAQYQMRTAQMSIPFEFSVQNRLLPAGDYSFVRIAPNRVNIRDANFHTVASLITHPVEARTAPELPKVVFSADGHALLRLWLESDRTGYEVSRSVPVQVLVKRQQPSAPVQAMSGSQE